MPTKKTELQVSPEVVLWKENKIKECRMEFSCGGDSMNDYSFKFYGDKGKEIECTELGDFFEDEVFRRVEFYEASDGHYIGEFGEVVITLNDNEDDFEYDKQSKSEWSESYSEEIPISITKKEEKFIKDKVDNINGGEGEKNINYKIDCIVTDEEDVMIDELMGKIDKVCSEHDFEDPAGEPEDFYSWSTNDNENTDIKIKGNNLYVSVRRSFIETREENW